MSLLRSLLRWLESKFDTPVPQTWDEWDDRYGS